jgi:drug/metabolite transporter (DMT)-like permease
VSPGLAAASLLFVAIWASAFTSAKVVVTEWPPLWALAIRFALTAPLLLAIARWRGAVLPGRGDIGRVALMGLLGVGGYLAFAWLALARIPSGLVALLSAATPLFVAAGERLLHGRYISPRAWLGLALGWLGVALLGAVRAADGLAGAEVSGVLLALLGAASQAAGILAYAPARGRVDLWSATLGQSMVSAAALLVLALLLDGAPPALPGAATLAGLLWSIVVVGIGAYALLFLLLRRLPPATAAALQLLAPPVAALFGWLLLGEALLWSDVVGGGLTLAGLLLLVRGR